MTATAKKRKRRDPRIGQAGDCAICHTFTGKPIFVSRRFFELGLAGHVPPAFRVHKNCDRLESRQAFRDRIARLRQAVAGPDVAAGELAAVETAEGPDGGRGAGTGQDGAGIGHPLKGPF